MLYYNIINYIFHNSIAMFFNTPHISKFYIFLCSKIFPRSILILYSSPCVSYLHVSHSPILHVSSFTNYPCFPIHQFSMFTISHFSLFPKPISPLPNVSIFSKLNNSHWLCLHIFPSMFSYISMLSRLSMYPPCWLKSLKLHVSIQLTHQSLPVY